MKHNTNWELSLANFESISLSELDAINFLDRKDTKSVFESSLMPQLLERLVPFYCILEIKGERHFRYVSYYLDTPDLKFYNDHQRNKARHHKVRFRKYVDGTSVFEIKTKYGRDRCRKKRIPANGNIEMSSSLKDIVRLHAGTDPDMLKPSLEVAASRITLLHKNASEKVTLDFDVQFSLNGKVKRLENGIIAEVKQVSFRPGSDFFRIQRQLGIHPVSISKYCVGVATLYEQVKANRFKASLLRISRIAR